MVVKWAVVLLGEVIAAIYTYIHRMLLVYEQIRTILESTDCKVQWAKQPCTLRC